MGNILFADGIQDEIPDYVISIKSGNKHGIGSTSSICLAFVNTDGKRCKKIEHICKWGEEFKPGEIKSFPIYNLPNLGELETMELTQRNGGGWFVQWVEVVDSLTKEKFIFPVHRWMKAGDKVTQKIYDALLPQDDENIEQRKKELIDKTDMYEFDWSIPGIMPLTHDVPADEDFSQATKDHYASVKRSLLLQGLYSMIKSKKWVKLEDATLYGGLFPTPPDVFSWREDRYFGTRRLIGANPCMIQLCTSIPDNLPVTNDMLQPIMENLTIEEAIEKKKLFMIDLGHLTDLPCKAEENKIKICAPIALFFVNKDQDLMPIAIQLHQTPGINNPIFLSTDPEFTWLEAKMWFTNADATEHQSATHLGLTHLLMETVCVATHRCLSPSHPIFRLLAPHFSGLLAINKFSRESLIIEGGHVDKILMCGVVGAIEDIGRRWKTWRLDVQGNLPNDLKDRGVDDPEALPNYYYRDDGLLYWDSIKKYVTIVVEGHYDTLTQRLQLDTEIQEWAKTLACESSGCGIKGVPGGGAFSTHEQIIETLTSIIFICSVGHASVNGPQYEMFSAPFSCLYLLGTPPTHKAPVDEKHIVNMLLEKKDVVRNMVLAYLLSTQAPNYRLGDFDIDYQFDPIGTKALEAFRKDLKTIGVVVEERNSTRRDQYTYLHPKTVTNSIGI